MPSDRAWSMAARHVPDVGPLLPQPFPDLRHLSFRGDFIGGKATMLFVTAEDWARWADDRRPPAFVDLAGAWVAVFMLDGPR